MPWQRIPLASWKRTIVEKNMALLAQILANILLFVSFGFYCQGVLENVANIVM